MVGRKRRARGCVLALVGVLVLGLGATAANADDDELVDVSKTTSEIQKKLHELRGKGRSARKGELSAAAVCGDDSTSQVFAPWGDTADYTRAPEGDLESTGGWELDKNDVTVIDENSPFSAGSKSLLLGDKGEAVTPVMCISTAHPTIRFFAQNTGSPESTLEIEVLYENVDGHTKKLRVAKLRGSDEWRPTRIVPIHVNVLAAASEDGLTAIALKFKAKDVRSKERHRGWKIDDVLVDPFKAR
jgi:hypothetical protein